MDVEPKIFIDEEYIDLREQQDPNSPPAVKPHKPVSKKSRSNKSRTTSKCSAIAPVDGLDPSMKKLAALYGGNFPQFPTRKTLNREKTSCDPRFRRLVTKDKQPNAKFPSETSLHSKHEDMEVENSQIIREDSYQRHLEPAPNIKHHTRIPLPYPRRRDYLLPEKIERGKARLEAEEHPVDRFLKEVGDSQNNRYKHRHDSYETNHPTMEKFLQDIRDPRNRYEPEEPCINQFGEIGDHRNRYEIEEQLTNKFLKDKPPDPPPDIGLTKPHYQEDSIDSFFNEMLPDSLVQEARMQKQLVDEREESVENLLKEDFGYSRDLLMKKKNYDTDESIENLLKNVNRKSRSIMKINPKLKDKYPTLKNKPWRKSWTLPVCGSRYRWHKKISKDDVLERNTYFYDDGSINTSYIESKRENWISKVSVKFLNNFQEYYPIILEGIAGTIVGLLLITLLAYICCGEDLLNIFHKKRQGSVLRRWFRYIGYRIANVLSSTFFALTALL